MTAKKKTSPKTAKRGRFTAQAIRPYVANLKPIPVAEQLRDQFNQLHREVMFLMGHSITRAIRAGEILTKLKKIVGHGHWRIWVNQNLEKCSMRTASRYMWCFEHAAELTGVQTIGEAMKQIRTERGSDAIGADYKRIRKGLLGPVRVVRQRLAKLRYVGDTPELIDQIKEELLAELEDLSIELSS